MNLHSDYPFWMISEGLRRSWPVLKEAIDTDVLVIGSGITGALVAAALCKAGFDVVVTEKRHVAHGSTAASTALLQYEIDTPLHVLSALRGERAARRSYELCHAAIDEIEALCRRFPGHAGFERRPSLWCASYKKHVEAVLRPEFAARRALGFDVSLLTEADIANRFGFSAPGAILSRQGAQVNPYLMNNFLLERAAAGGARIFELSEVHEMQATQRQVLATTRAGVAIKAAYAVVASGYESRNFLNADCGTLHSTYAIVSKPLPRKNQWWRNALIWETRDPYHYLRTTSDRRIIVGGRDEPFSSAGKRDRLIARKSRELRQYFGKLFPDIPFETDFAWAGTFGKTKDGLPYIGPAGNKRILHALGYGGNGITFSAIAADMLADMIRGRKNVDAELFAFGR